MPDRGYLGGLVYELPTNRYVQSPVAPAVDAGAAPFLQVPEAVDGLAQVEGLTDKYIDTRGKIEAYALDMQKRYGIDVTQPDYTQPGGGLPHKTFRNLATDLLVIANDLKQRRETEKTILPQLLAGNVRGVEGYDLTAPNAQNQFYSTKLLDEVEQANQILRTAVYTEADQKRFKEQVADPLIARLTQQMNAEGTTPAQKEFLRMNINALVQTPRTTPYAAFQNTGSKTNKLPFEVDFAKKVTNVARGKWGNDFLPSTDENGDPILINKSFSGKRAGTHTYTDGRGNEKTIPQYVDSFIKKPGGEIILTFKKGEGDVVIPPLNVSDMTGDEIASLFMGSNAKHGDVAKLYSAMRELGLADDAGSLIEDKVLAGNEFDVPDPSVFGKGIQQEKDRILGELQKIKGKGGISRQAVTLDLDGEKVVIKQERGFGDTPWFMTGAIEAEGLTEQDVIKALAKYKYFDKYLSESPNSTPTDKAQPEQAEVSQRAQELIDKYRQ